MKKRLFLFIPHMVVLVLVNIAAFIMALLSQNSWMYVAFVTLLLLSIVVFYLLVSMGKSINKFYQTMEKQLSPYTNKALKDFPLPVLVTRRGGEIIWYNNQMREKVLGGQDCFSHGLAEYFPSVNLAMDCPPQGYGVEYNGHQYTAYHAPTGEEDNRLNVLYLVDDDKLKRIAKEYFSSRPVAVIILIDNYEELLQSARENERSQIMGEIEYQIECYVENYHGVIKKLEKDRFFVAFEERYMKSIVEERFTILDTVRKINANDKMPATLSIGVGRDAQSLQQAEQFASQALDMALGRGGDQAAVKNKNGYEFYGGVSKGIEKRTKVKTRIVAAALSELLDSCANVLIMGHRFADLDCLGAAVGLYQPIQQMGKPVKIILNSRANMVKQLHTRLIEQGYDTAFIEPEVALDYVSEETLLIIVDVHTPHFIEAPEVYKKCKNVVVIDHHRKMVDYIDNAVIFHHEPYASSASEMVAELLQYFGDKYKPNSTAAEALLAGMMLDTKNFIQRTGVRTFEAAAYLRKLGADTVEVKRLFATSMNAYQERCKVVSSATVYRHCAVCQVEEKIDEIKMVSAQAADELLSIEDVDASFVFYYESDNVVAYSARSMGRINVQIIMEKLGGGGHLTMAGAQTKGIDLKEGKERLLRAIDEYYDTLQDKEDPKALTSSEPGPLQFLPSEEKTEASS
jgi:c-di-AMP phosphodiesterase-like protein